MREKDRQREIESDKEEKRVEDIGNYAWQEDRETEIEGLREQKVKKKLRWRESVKDRRLEREM